MSRRNAAFTVDAQQVQGNPGATVTFRAVTVGERREYLDSPDVDNVVMLQRHVVSWTGIVGNDDRELPNPADEPQAINALFMHEMNEMHRLLWLGPNGEPSKN